MSNLQDIGVGNYGGNLDGFQEFHRLYRRSTLTNSSNFPSSLLEKTFFYFYKISM